MNLLEIDFEGKLIRDILGISYDNEDFSKEQIAELVAQLDKIINDKNESSEKIAQAYVWKFQVLLDDYKLAPKLLEKALALCPNMPQALILTGVLCCFKEEERNYGKLLEYINKAIESESLYPFARRIHATVLKNFFREENHKEEILADYAEYIKLKPDCSFGYEKYGEYLVDKLSLHNRDNNFTDSEKQDIDTAIHYYSEAIKYNPSVENMKVESSFT